MIFRGAQPRFAQPCRSHFPGCGRGGCYFGIDFGYDVAGWQRSYDTQSFHSQYLLSHISEWLGGFLPNHEEKTVLRCLMTSFFATEPRACPPSFEPLL